MLAAAIPGTAALAALAARCGATEIADVALGAVGTLVETGNGVDPIVATGCAGLAATTGADGTGFTRGAGSTLVAVGDGVAAPECGRWVSVVVLVAVREVVAECRADPVPLMVGLLPDALVLWRPPVAPAAPDAEVSAWATPDPLASAAPRPSVIAPAPSQVYGSGRRCWARWRAVLRPALPLAEVFARCPRAITVIAVPSEKSSALLRLVVSIRCCHRTAIEPLGPRLRDRQQRLDT